VTEVGPVERRLAAVIAAALDHEIDPTALHAVRRAGAPGDIRVDLGSVTGSDGTAHAVAAATVLLPAVTSAVAVPPNLYITPTTAFVVETVVDRVVASDQRYASLDAGRGHRVLVSFSNPNLNKPLHVGHLRNNALGCSIANLAEAFGCDVLRGQVVSDWGRHLCEATVAYRRWGNGTTPEATGEKGDHFVGRFYVRFHRESSSELMDEAAALLRAMEDGDPQAVELNEVIANWAAEGQEETYRRIGTSFDVIVRESAARDRARDLIERAVAGEVCEFRDDGSVYLDLADLGLSEVTVGRSDGTLLVYSQLAGALIERYERTRFDTAIVVNGAQWADGNTAVDTLLKRCGHEWARYHEHRHYGMVKLPEGRMTSRSGQVAHADELVDEVSVRLAERLHLDAGEAIAEKLGVGLLKLAFLRVPESKSLTFDEQAVWGPAYHLFVSALQALAQAEAHSLWPPRDTCASNRASRELAMCANALPSVVARAFIRREPSMVARYLTRLTESVEGAARELPERDAMWRVAAIALRRTFALLDAEPPVDLSPLILNGGPGRLQVRPRRPIASKVRG